MKTADLDKIERDLDITLPSTYREFMTSVDHQEWTGNQDTDLWDDADALIARNLELRMGLNVGGRSPWCKNLFFIGDPLTACGNAIKLDDPRVPVLWIDHCDLEAPSSGEIAPSFVDWANSVIEALD